MKRFLFRHIMHYASRIVLSVLLITPFFASPVFAEEPATMDEVVVTATRIEESKRDVPASVQVITQDDIKDSKAKNAGDLISEASVGHIQKYPGALTGTISIRGLSTNLSSQEKSRVLVLINGHRAGTVNLAKIPAADIERIEIVKGPASVLYGSSAMGGAINIITKKGMEKGIHGSIGGDLGSWGYKSTTGEINWKKGAVDFYLTVGRSSKNDFRAADTGKIDNSAFKDETISARVGYSFSDTQRVSLGFQRWSGWDIGSPGAVYSPDPDNFSDKKREGYDIGYETDTLNTNYYFVKNDDKSYSGSTDNSDISLKETETQGASLQKIFTINNHRVILGGQWDRIDVESSRNKGNAPYSPNSRYDNYALFSEGRFGFMNQKLLLSAGVRYDYFNNKVLKTPGITSLVPKEDRLDHITARGGVVYKITEAVSIKGNVGTAFRAPAADELAADYTSSWGSRYLGNSDLAPEKSITYDAGVDYSKESLKGNVTVFHTNFDDKIYGYYDSGLSANTWKNVKGATIQGIEGSLSYDLGIASGLELSIKPFANVTYNFKRESDDQAEIADKGKTLLYVPRWTGAFGVKVAKENWDARIIANHTGDTQVQDWNSSSPSYGETVKKGNYTVVHLKGSLRPVKNLELIASVENLLDKEYAYVLGYPMPGRTFLVGARWIF